MLGQVGSDLVILSLVRLGYFSIGQVVRICQVIFGLFRLFQIRWRKVRLCLVSSGIFGLGHVRPV
jgi:hypothetical protein